MNFIDFKKLQEAGLLDEDDYNSVSFGEDEEIVDYALLFKVRRPILEKAVINFLADKTNLKKLSLFEEKNETWLDDYAEFMAIKEHFGNKSLQEWGDKRLFAVMRSVWYVIVICWPMKLATIRLHSTSSSNNGWR